MKQDNYKNNAVAKLCIYVKIDCVSFGCWQWVLIRSYLTFDQQQA